MNTLITALRQRKNAGVIVAALPTAGQSRSEECRAHAAECQEIANRWPDPIKHQYEELARQWQVVAEQAETPEERLQWASTSQYVRDFKEMDRCR